MKTRSDKESVTRLLSNRMEAFVSPDRLKSQTNAEIEIDIDLFEFEFTSVKRSLHRVITEECRRAIADTLRLEALKNWRYISSDIEDIYNKIVYRMNNTLFAMDRESVDNIKKSLIAIESTMHFYEWSGEFEQEFELSYSYDPIEDYSNTNARVSFKYLVTRKGEKIALAIEVVALSGIKLVKNYNTNYIENTIDYGKFTTPIIKSNIDKYLHPYFVSETVTHTYQDKQYCYMTYSILRRPLYRGNKLEEPNIYTHVTFSNGIENQGTETLNLRVEYFDKEGNLLLDVPFTEEMHDAVFYDGSYERSTFQRDHISIDTGEKLDKFKVIGWRSADSGKVTVIPITKIIDYFAD